MGKGPSAPTNEQIYARWDGLFQAVNHSEDLVCVVTAASYVDYTLAELLKSHFIESSLVNGLLSPTGGALGHLVARADVAYCLGLLTKEDRTNVAILASIRNRFSHRIDEVSFDDPEIQDRCDELSDILFSLPQFQDLAPVADGGARHRERSRTRFRLTAIHLCTRMTIAALSAEKCTRKE